MRTGWQTARARRWLRLSQRIGERPRLNGRPTIEQFGGEIRIGDDFYLASSPVPSHLAVGPGAILDVGNDVAIGYGAAIAAFQQVRIGDGTRIGPYVIIMDTSFHDRSGDQSVQHDCRPVVIGAGCRIGSRVTIMRGVSIGDGAEILAGSVVTSTIPAGVCAGGGRARVIGPAGDMTTRWDSAAAILPELVMTALGLDSPPTLDGGSIPSHLWTDTVVHSLIHALETRLQVTVDSSTIRDARTVAELSAAVERTRIERQQTPRRL
jgi:acetyltransferase-like isoleucine patch superfamily enzyme